MTARPPAALPAPADTPDGPEPTRHAAPATVPAPDAALAHDHPLHHRPLNHRPLNHRSDGWTPERQRLFVEGLAGGDTVDRACARVALSPASAYAFRRRAAGAAFALAWDGARLLARETLADTLLTRALEGQEEVITRPDGSVVTRHRFDNRLATHMLHRLDRFSDAAQRSAHGTAARTVAGEFDAYLDLIDADATPAHAGLFVAERLAPHLAASDAPAHPAALEPVLALARADRWLAGHPATTGEVDVTDLDPAARAHWTAEQWARAEAAGLLALAPAPARDCQLSQLPPEITPYVSPADRPEPVWWCDHADAWRTRFPPPDDFLGEEFGEWGDADYERELDPDEIDQIEAPARIHAAVRHVTEARTRDQWFAQIARTSLDQDAGPDQAQSRPDTPEPPATAPTHPADDGPPSEAQTSNAIADAPHDDTTPDRPQECAENARSDTRTTLPATPPRPEPLDFALTDPGPASDRPCCDLAPDPPGEQVDAARSGLESPDLSRPTSTRRDRHRLAHPAADQRRRRRSSR